jgi:hypothetical protein
MMHGTDLTRCEAWTALFIVGRDRRLAAERDRRRHDASDLARKPEADDPRQTTTDGKHERDQSSTPFVVMIK